MALSPGSDPASLFQTESARQTERRLAQFEYRAMVAELLTGRAFELTMAFGARPHRVAAPPETPILQPRPPGIAALLPPLGAVAVQTTATPLPCTAILIRDVPPKMLGAQLLEFLTEHNHKPFMRPLFLCETMAPVPLLSRYGFVCLPLQGADPVIFAKSVAAKFNLEQLRALSDGALLWTAPAS